MKNYKSQSTEQPNEWDLTSSEMCVYKNTNIVESQATEDTPKMYNYDVEEYTRYEYESLVLAQTRADTDYLLIMTGV
jgi:hypothetical protein